ncbi:MAG TPA: DUF1801 domain-containing protein [Draconibacterium sp.]|nr:DUF1801 domain-containing protein [Draconibacterium sp.]
MSPVEIFILDQPENLKPILKKLRGLILSASPFILEKMVYNIPFFYGKKRIFYLNPQENRVDLGFCEGYLLEENPILETKNRTQVRTIRFYSINEIEEDTVLPIIHEAIIIDQLKNKKEK